MSETNSKRAVMGGPKGRPSTGAKMSEAFPKRGEEVRKLTLNLPASSHAKFKRAALDKGTSMTDLLIEFIDSLDD